MSSPGTPVRAVVDTDVWISARVNALGAPVQVLAGAQWVSDGGRVHWLGRVLAWRRLEPRLLAPSTRET